MRKYEAKVRAGNGIVMPVTVEAENRMYAIEMVNGMYGAENVLMPAVEVFEAYKRTPVRAPAPSVDALSEARIAEKKANEVTPDFSYTQTYASPVPHKAHPSHNNRIIPDNTDGDIAKVFLVCSAISLGFIWLYG